MTQLTTDAQIALVRAYFKAVDDQDLNAVLATMTPDCSFAVETHGVHLTDRGAITAMFRRLWRNHAAVKHHRFRFVADPHNARIAAQFQVQNTELDGALTFKSNCNVFDMRDGRFSHISVYMTGANTLDQD